MVVIFFIAVAITVYILFSNGGSFRGKNKNITAGEHKHSDDINLSKTGHSYKWRETKGDSIDSIEIDNENYKPERSVKYLNYKFIFIVSILAIIAGKFFGHEVANSLTKEVMESREEKLRKSLIVAALEARKNLPMRADEITTLVGVEAIENRLVYDLALDSSIRSEVVQSIAANIEAANKRRICRDKRTEEMVGEGAILEWRYWLNTEIVATASVSSCK